MGRWLYFAPQLLHSGHSLRAVADGFTSRRVTSRQIVSYRNTLSSNKSCRQIPGVNRSWPRRKSMFGDFGCYLHSNGSETRAIDFPLFSSHDKPLTWTAWSKAQEAGHTGYGRGHNSDTWLFPSKYLSNSFPREISATFRNWSIKREERNTITDSKPFSLVLSFHVKRGKVSELPTFPHCSCQSNILFQC